MSIGTSPARVGSRAILFAAMLGGIGDRCFDTRLAAAEPAVVEKAPAAAVIVVDRSRVLRESKAAQSMLAQAEAFSKRNETVLAPQRLQLKKEVQYLQWMHEGRSPSWMNAKSMEYREHRLVFEKRVQELQAALDAGLARARLRIETALGVVLQKIMSERGANLAIDKSFVQLGSQEFDVTNAVIARLNTKLSKVTVTVQPSR